MLLPLVFTSATLAGAAEELEPGLTVELLEDGIWLFRSDKDWGDGKPIRANGLLVVGRSAVAMLDTAWTDEQTGRLIDWAESRFERPVRHVLATHWHWDRMGGMAEVNRRGITGYAHRRSAELGSENGIDPPRITFERSLRIDLGDETIEAFYPGPGHTEDNTVIWLERRGILHGGCLVKSAETSNLGYVDEADIGSWPATLDRLLERYRQARVVVPGHGEAGDVSLIDHTRTLVQRER